YRSPGALSSPLNGAICLRVTTMAPVVSHFPTAIPRSGNGWKNPGQSPPSGRSPIRIGTTWPSVAARITCGSTTGIPTVNDTRVFGAPVMASAGRPDDRISISTSQRTLGTGRLRVFVLLFAFASASSAWAQKMVTVSAQPVRVTVPDSFTGSTLVTNSVTIGGGSSQVNLTVFGLPPGVGYSFDIAAFTESGGANLTLNTTNVSPGEHVLSIDASGGAENHFLLTLQSGRMWTGETNVTGHWSAASSWVGRVPPGAADDVLFTQLGAQTNTAGFTNSIVDVDTTISSLRFSQTDGTARFHTLLIDSGR